jgi:flagellar motor switch protein FliN/FliY
MAGEDSMNLLGDVEQGLAPMALPPADIISPAAKTFRRDSAHRGPAPVQAAGGNALHNTPVTLRIELGRAQLHPEDVSDLRNGSIVPLDRPAADPVDIFADGQLAARGEVVALDGHLAIRVLEVIAARKRKLKYQETC